MNKISISVITSILLLNIVFADPLPSSRDTTTPVNNSTINSVTVGSAADWHLNDTEWQHYLILMRGASGKWYKQLTPAEVLGINAETPEDREHFAELVAHQEHDKIERELLFDHAFHLAMQKLYADEPIIKPFNVSQFNPIKTKAQ